MCVGKGPANGRFGAHHAKYIKTVALSVDSYAAHVLQAVGNSTSGERDTCGVMSYGGTADLVGHAQRTTGGLIPLPPWYHFKDFAQHEVCVIHERTAPRSSGPQSVCGCADPGVGCAGMGGWSPRPCTPSDGALVNSASSFINDAYQSILSGHPITSSLTPADPQPLPWAKRAYQQEQQPQQPYACTPAQCHARTPAAIDQLGGGSGPPMG